MQAQGGLLVVPFSRERGTSLPGDKSFPWEKKNKNHLPESNENDFNSLKLKRGGEATTLHDNEGEKGGVDTP